MLARSALAATVLALTLAHVPGRPVGARPHRPPTASVSEPRLPNGKRALLIGDSNFFGPLGRVLSRELARRGYRVTLVAKSASGLAHPQFFNWFQTVPDLLRTSDPDVVIALFGGNDGQPITPLRGDEPTRLSFKDRVAWDAAYKARVRELAELLRGSAREVFLLSPTNRPEPARARVVRIKGLQHEAVRDLVRVHAVDLFPVSTAPDGSYLKSGLDPDGRAVRYRRHDGVHLTPAGGEVVGRRLMDFLVATFGL